MNVKQAIRKMPIVGPISYRLWPSKSYSFAAKDPFVGSSEYWDRRYAQGGNSGAGSYNRLAEFKAEVINDFVLEHEIGSVIEFGCGDGAQLELAKYPAYVGVDVSPTIINRVKRKFSKFPNYRFVLTGDVTPEHLSDLSLSLDVIYHLVEDDTFSKYMTSLFDFARKAVIVYASNEDRQTADPHVRHRKFTSWVEQNRPDFVFMNHIPNRYPFDKADPDNTSFADFYIFRSVNY